MSKIRPTDKIALAGVINPDAYTAATYTSGWVAVKNYNAFAALISVGTMASTSTVDAKIEQATSAAGAGAKDVTGKAITQLTEAGTDSDKEAWINLLPSELDVDNNFTHIRVSMTVAAAASDAAAYLFGLDSRYGPASDNDSSTVDEIVA